jgi:hypothetical protein
MPAAAPIAAHRQPRLSDQRVADFRRDGYLLFQEPVYPQAKFERLAAHFDQLLARWLADPKTSSPEHMDTPHFFYPSLFEWLFDDAVLDLVEPIIGPDIALFSSHFICKPAGSGKRVPWHEDSAYWKGRLDPMQVVTVWLALDPSTPGNGCMRVIPGTHHHGFSDYEAVADPHAQVFATEMKKGSYDESKAVDCVLAPNQCSLHDGKLVHGSAPNTGTVRRCGYTMRFIPTTVKHAGGKDDPFQIYLARGQDRAGNHYADPGQVNRRWIDAYPDGYPTGH